MKKFLKISAVLGSVLVLILIFMLLFPFVFREKFTRMVKNTARESLKTEMNFSEMKVSFFHHFPRLTLSLSDFYLFSAAPFSQDTLISARDISFGIDLISVFRSPIRISGVYIDRGKVKMMYNEKGTGNFDVFNTSAGSAKDSVSSSGSADIRIESISFVNTDFLYADYSIPMHLTCYGINYEGNSTISSDILKLRSKIRIDSLNFNYDKVDYVKSKPVHANLETTINLKSFDIDFDKNDLLIKDVPFEFKGEMNFRKNSYDLFLSLYSTYNEEWISGSVQMVSTEKLWVSLKTDINMRLENWVKRLGIRDYDLRGLFRLKLNIQGDYITGPDPASPGDTVILSIPDISLTSGLSNGYFRFTSLPKPLENISFDLKAGSRNHDYRTLSLQLENFRATFLKNLAEGYFRIDGFRDLPIDMKIKTSVNLAELKQVMPMDSLDLTGILDMDITSKGNFAPDKKKFPVTHAVIGLREGMLKTQYSPHPLENINISAEITNESGTLAGTHVMLRQLGFRFLNNPFTLTADLRNPDDLVYRVTSKGSVDLAGIYRMFSQEGMNLSGFVQADLQLRGSQGDAMAGRIGRLDNKGTLILKNIAFSSDYLPRELILKNGKFRFDNDRIWFERFESRCGRSVVILDGSISNVVNYALSENQILKGNLRFRSDFVDIADFMSPSDPAAPQTAPSPAGVVVIPPGYDFSVIADLKKINFEGNMIDSLTANLQVDSGLCILKNMQFSMIGCRVNMDATYGSTNPVKAFFSFHVKAENFDVQRAYREVEMFRNLASSAEKCEGIISIDYSIKGRLINDMDPVYPSLEGGGVVTLSKVKVMGLKLFTAMSSNLGREKLKDPDLRKVELKTTIRNNIITLEQTRMKISGFRLRIAGESSFDGRLNLKSRVGLPPLGIVGIPLRILGTMDDPKFRYGRGNSDEQLEETEYSDEIPAEFLEKIKQVKEEEDDGNDE